LVHARKYSTEGKLKSQTIQKIHRLLKYNSEKANNAKTQQNETTAVRSSRLLRHTARKQAVLILHHFRKKTAYILFYISQSNAQINTTISVNVPEER